MSKTKSAKKGSGEKAKKGNGSRRLTHAEFTLRAIRKLRTPPYLGIHSVYKGYNKAFREYFGTCPVVATKKLAAEGVIDMRIVRGGALLWVAGEQPLYDPSKPKEEQPIENPTLNKILAVDPE